MLKDYPYLTFSIVETDLGDMSMEKVNGKWKKYWKWFGKKDYTIFKKAKILEGYGLNKEMKLNVGKAKIRKILKPTANRLLEDMHIIALLDKQREETGSTLIILNGVTFWYEDETVKWQVKESDYISKKPRAALWFEGEVISKNYGRLIILPYLQTNGRKKIGHTKNGPYDGPAKKRQNKKKISWTAITDNRYANAVGLLGALPLRKIDYSGNLQLPPNLTGWAIWL